MIGQVIRPSVQVTGQMHLANSVDPKPFGHGNPELNSTQVDKCVQSRYEASKLDEGVLGTLWKHSELTRNKLVTYQNGYVVTDCVMLMMVDKSQPPYRVIGKVQKANSVKAKAECHANTELNSDKSDKCVETMGFLPIKGNDIVRALWKHKELNRNDLADIDSNIVTDNRMWHNRHDFISGCQGNCHFSLREYHWLVYNRRDLGMRNSWYRSCFSNYNPSIYPDRQSCSGFDLSLV